MKRCEMNNTRNRKCYINNSYLCTIDRGYSHK